MMKPFANQRISKTSNVTAIISLIVVSGSAISQQPTSPQSPQIQRLGAPSGHQVQRSSDQAIILPDGSIRGVLGSSSNNTNSIQIINDPDSALLLNLRNSLAVSRGPDERIRLAIQLRQAAQDVAVRRQPRYQQQADREFHVPELASSVAKLLETERRDPNNPRTGVHADQTLFAMDKLQSARGMANQHVAAIAAADAEVIGALNASDAEIRLHGFK